MSNYLPATLGIAVMLMASPTLSKRRFGAKWGQVAEGLETPSLNLPTNYFAKMSAGPFMSLQINGADVLPPIPSEELTLEMLIRDVDSFNSRTAQWGPNPMEAAMKERFLLSEVRRGREMPLILQP